MAHARRLVVPRQGAPAARGPPLALGMIASRPAGRGVQPRPLHRVELAVQVLLEQRMGEAVAGHRLAALDQALHPQRLHQPACAADSGPLSRARTPAGLDVQRAGYRPRR